MGVVVQIMGTFLLCCPCMFVGVMFAWPSSTLRLFESANTTLHRPMSESEISLFGSLSSIGALIGTPIMGILLDRIGRKYSTITGSLLGVLSWAMITASNRVEVLLSAMFVSGLSSSVFLVVPAYIGEISQENIRGAMTSGPMLFYGIGMLFSYLLGGYLKYYTMTYVCLSISVVGTVLLSILKESPTLLMLKGLEKEAAESIAYYKSTKPYSKEVLEEIYQIRQSLNPEMDDVNTEEERLKPQANSSEKLSLWNFIKKSHSTRQALFITLVIFTTSISQGLVVVQVYAEPVFEEAIPSLSATLCSILFAVISTIAGLVASYLTEFAGRRPLIIYGSIGAALSCLVLGTQLHLHWGPNWLKAITMYLFCVLYTIGAGTVPYVIIAEVFLPKVKSFMSMLVMEWAWLCNSIILFIFNPLLKAIGLGPVFYIFSAVCLTTAVFSIYFLPETKGLPINAIQKILKKKKRGRKVLLEGRKTRFLVIDVTHRE